MQEGVRTKEGAKIERERIEEVVRMQTGLNPAPKATVILLL